MIQHSKSKSSSIKTRVTFGALAIVASLIALWFSRSHSEPELLASVATNRPATPTAALEPESEAQLRTQAEMFASPAKFVLNEKSATPQAAIDLKEKAWITLHVVDEQGAPVAGAVVTHLWTFCEREGGSESTTATIETAPAATGTDGRLRIAYPLRHALDCVVNELGLALYHPDFAPSESVGMPITSDLEVVLQRGEVLVLSGWIGSPDHVINDFDAQFSSEVEVEDSDWLPRRDGRRTTSRVPAGKHQVKLRHWAPEGVWWSALTDFEIVPGLATEVHVELLAAVHLRGRLSDDVPRPVIDGRVAIAFAKANPGNESSSGFYSRVGSKIAADGSFEVPFLSPESAQIIAICRGWVVRRDLPSSVPVPAVLESPAGNEPPYPYIELRGLVDEVTIAMEPTATLELCAQGPEGAALAGVQIDIYPNVCWDGVGCAGLVFDFGWHATTDAAGFARIDSVPPGEHWVFVAHPEFQLVVGASGGTSKRRQLRLASGEALRSTMQFERTPHD